MITKKQLVSNAFILYSFIYFLIQILLPKLRGVAKGGGEAAPPIIQIIFVSVHYAAGRDGDQWIVKQAGA